MQDQPHHCAGQEPTVRLVSRVDRGRSEGRLTVRTLGCVSSFTAHSLSLPYHTLPTVSIIFSPRFHSPNKCSNLFLFSSSLPSSTLLLNRKHITSNKTQPFAWDRRDTARRYPGTTPRSLASHHPVARVPPTSAIQRGPTRSTASQARISNRSGVV